MMRLDESIKICFTKFNVIAGRATRSEFWWFTLFTGLVNIIARTADGNIDADMMTMGTLETLWFLIIILPSICVFIRRLHDLSLSAWNLTYLIVAVFVGLIMLEIPPWDTLGAVIVLLSVIFYIYVLFAIGHEKDNDYGPNPY